MKRKKISEKRKRKSRNGWFRIGGGWRVELEIV